MSTDPAVVQRRPGALTAPISTTGTAAGTLIGGNLTAVATSVGVRLPDLSGAILFLEDLRHKGLGFVDRLLTQLLMTGSLEGVVGVVLGSFDIGRWSWWEKEEQ